MSKSCNVISDTEEQDSELQSPMTFGQLDSLTDQLIEETKNAEMDFSKKAASAAEGDIKASDNNELLTRCNEEIHKFKTRLAKVDAEIVEHERTLCEIHEMLNKLEELQNTKPCPQAIQNDIRNVLGLIETLDTQITLAAEDIEIINVLFTAEDVRPTSARNLRVIYHIMNLHLNLLLEMERRLAPLHANCEAVERQLLSIKQKQLQLLQDST